MSRRFAKKLYNLYDIVGVPNACPFIKWTKDKKRNPHYTFAIPYDVSVGRGGKVSEISVLGDLDLDRKNFFQFEITEGDLNRLLVADKVKEELYFSFADEQGDLPDVVYYCISLIQGNWYLSKDILNKAKRASKRIGYPQWISLAKRENKGGQRKGVLKKERVLSLAEKERLETLVSDHDRIVTNCIRHDWAEEYCELEKEVAKYLGQPVLSRKLYLQKFGELRRAYYNKN